MIVEVGCITSATRNDTTSINATAAGTGAQHGSDEGISKGQRERGAVSFEVLIKGRFLP